MKTQSLRMTLFSTLLSSFIATQASAQDRLPSVSGYTVAGLSNALCTHMVTGTIAHNLEALSQHSALQEMIQILGAECGLNSTPAKVSHKPVLYVVEGTEVAFLNDSYSISFGAQALAAKEMGLLAKSTPIVVLKSQAIAAQKTVHSNGMQMSATTQLPISTEERYTTYIPNRPTERFSAKSNVTVEATGLRGFAARIENRLAEIYRNGQNEVYVSGIAYHDRNTYTPEKLRDLNEKAYGFGLGKSVINSDGNYESIYGIGFLDSHSDLELNVGYMWQKIFRLSRSTSVGAGYTAGLVSRSDIFKGFPVPYAFPAVSLNVGKVSFMGVLIPQLNGGINNGNVLFLFAKLPVEKLGNPTGFSWN